MQQAKKYTPAVLPANKYAFTGNVYLSKDDFQALRSTSTSTSSSTSIMVQINKFVFKAESLPEIESNTFGANSNQREMLELSKLDSVSITNV